MRIKEFMNFFTSYGLSLNAPEGFCFGDIHGPLTGVMVSFTANLPAIMASKSAGCNLMVIHERMYFPTSYSKGLLEKHLSDRINLPRIQALIDSGITVLLAADSIELPFIRRAFESAMGLPPNDILTDPYIIPKTTLKDFSSQVLNRLNLDNIRVTGDHSKNVQNLVIMNGGEGITRHADCMIDYIRQNPDLIICGETDEYPQWAVKDLGMGMLQIGHTVFDNIGLRYLVKQIHQWQPDMKVDFFEITKPWRIT